MRGPLQRLDHRDGGDQEGRGRQIAADLLEHDPRLDMAEPEPAVGLADQDAGEAQFGELLPQRVAEAVLAAHVAIFAQLAGDRPSSAISCRAVSRSMTWSSLR